jgi:hypothetical protein
MGNDCLIKLACAVTGLLFAVLEIIAIFFAFKVGKEVGYNQRVEEEKLARGV